MKRFNCFENLISKDIIKFHHSKILKKGHLSIQFLSKYELMHIYKFK